MMFNYNFLNAEQVKELYNRYAWSSHSYSIIAIPYGIHEVQLESVLIGDSAKFNKYLRVSVTNTIDYIPDGNSREYIYPKMYFVENTPDYLPFSSNGLNRLCAIHGIDSSSLKSIYEYCDALQYAKPVPFLILCEHHLSLSLDEHNRPKKNKYGKFIVNRQPYMLDFSPLNDDRLFRLIDGKPLIKDLSFKEKLIIKNSSKHE